jgi:Ser/Thr protein kinase RdoA (MazF antagonist)
MRVLVRVDRGVVAVKVSPSELPRASALFERGRWSEHTTCTRLSGGSRHKVFLLEDGERSAVLKLYGGAGIAASEPFHHETVVHGFLARHLPASVPRVLDLDEAARCVLFEWIQGERPSASQINHTAMTEMARFVAVLNRLELRGAAREAGLPQASDAAFDFAGHRERAWLRLEALTSRAIELPVVEEMKRFVRSELIPACLRTEGNGKRMLQPPEYALSPSDFGFHNVLVRPSGQWTFLDFEHAGWDDPAKLVADFFLQPECPLDANLQGAFFEALKSGADFGEDFAQRVACLLPVQAIKWTTVILNAFHHELSPTVTPRLQERLAKAKSYWARKGAFVAYES